jgi:hypothetical protein
VANTPDIDLISSDIESLLESCRDLRAQSLILREQGKSDIAHFQELCNLSRILCDEETRFCERKSSRRMTIQAD